MIVFCWILLKMTIFQSKFVDKIKIQIFYSVTFFRKSYSLWDNVETYGRARQATDDNIIRRMRFACWITKATDTRSKCAVLTAFPRQQLLPARATVLCWYVHYLSAFCKPVVRKISAFYGTRSYITLWICHSAVSGANDELCVTQGDVADRKTAWKSDTVL